MNNSTYFRQTPVMLPWRLIVLVDKTALLNKHFVDFVLIRDATGFVQLTPVFLGRLMRIKKRQRSTALQ